MASLSTAAGDYKVPTFSKDLFFLKNNVRYKGFCARVDNINHGRAYVDRPTMEALWSSICNQKAMTCPGSTYEDLHQNGVLAQTVLQLLGGEAKWDVEKYWRDKAEHCASNGGGVLNIESSFVIEDAFSPVHSAFFNNDSDDLLKQQQELLGSRERFIPGPSHLALAPTQGMATAYTPLASATSQAGFSVGKNNVETASQSLGKSVTHTPNYGGRFIDEDNYDDDEEMEGGNEGADVEMTM